MTTATATADDVLTCWFGTHLAPGEVPPQEVSRRWFRKDPAFDATLAERFGPTLAAAERGERDAWIDTPRGAVALIIVLDQMTRNIHRGSGDAFRNDERARSAMERALAAGHWQTLPDLHRYFLLMPAMHSEDLDVHRWGRARFVEARDEARNDAARSMLETALDFMDRHTEIVARFGRYPHRNAALGRESTDAERAFLEQPGSSF